MHTQYNGVQSPVDLLQVPAKRRWQQPFFFKVRQGRLEYLVIAAADLVTLVFQGNSQLMHDAAADGDKMYIHGEKLKGFKISLLSKKLSPPSSGACKIRFFILTLSLQAIILPILRNSPSFSPD